MLWLGAPGLHTLIAGVSVNVGCNGRKGRVLQSPGLSRPVEKSLGPHSIFSDDLCDGITCTHPCRNTSPIAACAPILNCPLLSDCRDHLCGGKISRDSIFPATFELIARRWGESGGGHQRCADGGAAGPVLRCGRTRRPAGRLRVVGARHKLGRSPGLRPHRLLIVGEGSRSGMD
jgi:hypothetical protein